MKNLGMLVALVFAIGGCTVEVGKPQQGRQAVDTGTPQQDEAVDTGTAEQQKSVVAAARQVAALLDQGKFEDAWAGGSPMLKGGVSQSAFALAVRTTRASLGAAGHREITGFNFPKVLDGVRGDFGLVGVETDFANAQAVQEKFVFQKVDGHWKLAGYWLTKKVTLAVDAAVDVDVDVDA